VQHQSRIHWFADKERNATGEQVATFLSAVVTCTHYCTTSLHVVQIPFQTAQLDLLSESLAPTEMDNQQLAGNNPRATDNIIRPAETEKGYRQGYVARGDIWKGYRQCYVARRDMEKLPTVLCCSRRHEKATDSVKLPAETYGRATDSVMLPAETWKCYRKCYVAR
jgi:hypothetical protein